ncbi:MAG: amino acid adenylation domain-containing protein [Sphingomonas sp.]|jgi:amino acid adenylation domain-containing protein
MTAMRKIDPAIAARRELLARMLSGDAGQGTAGAAPEPISPRAPGRTVPLTAEQNQLWLHQQMAPEMPLYNESITIHRLGRYDHAALERALSEVVRRHAIWRTAFVDVDGEVRQVIAEARHMPLAIIDISHLAPAAREDEAVRLAAEDARAAIPLDQAPLFRARVVKLGEEEHRLYLTLHHIIFDGVSIYRTLVPELAALVAAYEAGRPSPLAEPVLQYADYAAWQQDHNASEDFNRQLDFWRGELAGELPRLEIPGDRARPALPTHAGSMEVFELAEPLIERLKNVAQREGATLYMVLLAAYKAMLFRYTGDQDIIVGGVTDTRRRPELQPLMGYFLNTMALRTRPRGDVRFRDYLAQVRQSVVGALGASDIPFDRLVRELGIKRGVGTHPLFNTLFSIEPPVDPFPAGWDLTQMDVVVGAAKYDLYLELDERPEGGMAGRFLYSTELYDPATIRRMIGHWRNVLQAVADEPSVPLAWIPMLDDAEGETLVDRWNATDAPLPHASVVDWFAETAAQNPQATAIEQDGEQWSYADLDQRADAIAARLIDEGVAAGDLVGLCVNRSPWMVAAMLGVARAGAAYLPLDPGFPPARLAMIVESAAPALILAEPDTQVALPVDGARVLHLSRDWPVQPCQRPAIGGDDLAYVLYTSGSTGKPKGVEIPHGALANLLMAMQREPGFSRGESLLAITTLSFDIAELELWLPLVSGGRIILAAREQVVDMAALIDLIAATRPDVMQATPATWRGLIEMGWPGEPGMRALCGGEALPRVLVEQMLPRVAELWNMYGPTETTIWSTCARITSADGPIVIGRPIANTQVRVQDADGNDKPMGAVGELLIGGLGVARGYRGQPGMTADRFIDHHGDRLYRTGDLARWRADGTLECFGRTDHEEKIRGFRVAIEEVEGALARLPGVTGAAVRAWPDASGERALAGYLVGEGDVATWRERLASMLPDYMIPTSFTLIDALPMTPNGKIDRKALPEPGRSLVRDAELPASHNEERLAEIWRAVLKVDTVYRDDDFFDLGGHSLLVARLLRRIEAEYGLRVPMAALFRAPRLADMAAMITSGQPIERPALIPIQPRGKATPIIWLDGGSTFLALAERLGLNQPFLGFSVDLVMENAGGCPRKFEDVARLVVDALVELQPEGPFRLGGWCTSGILAYAVAHRLRAMGRDVPLLMLAHPFHPERAREIGRVRFFLSKVRFHIAQSMAQPKGERGRYFRERLRGLSDAAALAGGREAVLQPELRTQLDRVATRYSPPDYAGDVIVFQPQEHPAVLDFIDDWRRHVMGRYDAFTVPGGHRTMLEPPNVDMIARCICEAIERIDGAAIEAGKA